MIWKNKNINKHRVIDSKDLSQNTQEIKLDKEAIKLFEESMYNEEFKEYEKHKKIAKRKTKKIFIIIVALLIMFLSVFSFIFARYLSKISHMEEEANKYISKENYRGAIEIYRKLYDETGDIEYSQKIKYVNSILENTELLKEANSMILSQDYENAVERLLTISSTDEKSIKTINKMLNKAIGEWINEVEILYLDNRIDEALIESEKMANMLPDNEFVLALREKVSNKKLGNTDEKEVLSSSNSRNIVENKKKKMLSEKSKSIIATEQYVTALKANVRENHDKDSNIMDNLEKGDIVYIEDTFIENSSRMWCKVTYFSNNNRYITGWILFDTLDGTVR